MKVTVINTQIHVAYRERSIMMLVQYLSHRRVYTQDLIQVEMDFRFRNGIQMNMLLQSTLHGAV